MLENGGPLDDTISSDAPNPERTATRNTAVERYLLPSKAYGDSHPPATSNMTNETAQRRPSGQHVSAQNLQRRPSHHREDSSTSKITAFWESTVHNGLSLQEALMEVLHPMDMPRVKGDCALSHSSPKSPVFSLRDSRIFTSVVEKIRKHKRNNKTAEAPRRPHRPPPQQCPSYVDDTNFLTVKNKDWQQATTNILPQEAMLSETSHDVVSLPYKYAYSSNARFSDAEVTHKAPENVDHASPYMLLTGYDSNTEEYILSFPSTRNEDCNAFLTSNMNPPKTSTRRCNVHSSISEASHTSRNANCSALSVTDPTLVLQPPPLRCRKISDCCSLPPILPRSPLRCSMLESNATKNHISNSEEGWDTPYCASSHYSVSDESSDNNEDTKDFGDKPPSPSPSPSPGAPLRDAKRHLPKDTDAEDLADKFREELGLIDDVYNLYADPTKAHLKLHKREASTIDMGHDDIPRPRPSRATTEKLSRTHQRCVKARARKETERLLEGIGPCMNAGDQGATLEPLAGDVSYTGTLLSCQDKDTTPPRRSMSRHTLLSRDTSFEPFDHRRHRHSQPDGDSNDKKGTSYDMLGPRVGQPSFAPSIPRHDAEAVGTQQTDDDADSVMSLPQMHRKLRELMTDTDDDEVEQTPPSSPFTPGLTNTQTPSSSSHASILTADLEVGPLNLRRIEIIHNGKKYPVLLGPGGKIYEGPCTIGGCGEHGRRMEDSRI